MACSRIPSSAARENKTLWQQEWQRKRRGAVDCLSVEKWSISLRDAGVREVATSQPSSPSTLSLKHSQVGNEMELIKNSWFSFQNFNLRQCLVFRPMALSAQRQRAQSSFHYNGGRSARSGAACSKVWWSITVQCNSEGESGDAPFGNWYATMTPVSARH